MRVAGTSSSASAVLSVAALAALAGPAPAMDPRVPVLSAEQGPEAKVAGFRRATAQDPALSRALEEAVRQGVPARDQVHRALCAVAAYDEALRGFERTGDDAEEWRVVFEEAPADAVHLRAHAAYFLGLSLLARDDLEGAAEVLEAVRGPLRHGTPWTDEATLYLAWAYARLPDLDQTLAAAARSRARLLLAGLVPEEGKQDPLYPHAPERVVEGARWLLRELSGEGLGPLLELAKRMETIERLLRRTRTDEPTQGKERDVVAVLDRLIELLREKEQGG